MRKILFDQCILHKYKSISTILYTLRDILTNIYASLFLIVLIVFLIFYLIYAILTLDSLNNPPIQNKHYLKKRDYTFEELKQCNGKDGADMLVAVGGKVFDVSCRGYYLFCEGAPFNIFLGKDATRALAIFSIDSSAFRDHHDDLCDLTSSQLENAKEWLLQFEEQYPCVGKLIKNYEAHTDYEESFEYEYANCDVADTSSNDNSNYSLK